jgi:hypothetical protein
MYAGKGYGGRLSRDWEAASRGRSLLLRIWSFPSAPPRRSGDVRAETSLHQVDNLHAKFSNHFVLGVEEGRGRYAAADGERYLWEAEASRCPSAVNVSSTISRHYHIAPLLPRE